MSGSIGRRRSLHGPLRSGLRCALLAGLMVAGGSSAIGLQDIAGRLAHQPGVAERARLSILAGPVHTLKAAAFAWPARSSLLTGSAIAEPPPEAPLALVVERGHKGDRLPVEITDPADPFASAGQSTGPGLVGSGTGTGTGTELLATTGSGVGTGTGLPITTLAGLGTDPAETEEASTPRDLAALDHAGVDSLSAGDPTGDPSQLERALAADAPATRTGLDEGMGGSLGDLAAGELGRDLSGGLDIDEAVAADAALPLYRQASYVFGYDTAALPPQPFLHQDGLALPLSPPAPPAPPGGTTTAAKSEGADGSRLASGPSPAERLGLTGKRRERSEKCLAEAVYFESRGEPRRGQVAVAQVVINRVFSGYYPADICRAVYQNANRKLACQFTFACDNIKDVVTEPRLWKQAQEIAAEMLDGLVWDDKVGRATHYHAQSVRPNWLSEMRKLDRIGEHTFYRPRRWTS
ncbi:cell wall hydrolase [Ancylobacter sp. WKF20]|uniref:cell wall hydrolase n=1 Tax=Ancylobacter sp. WKF20 TaxID=3039801 RepID=UPI00243468BE|nr:cell wall hydrolase [Ancylobacter sp. WKF20]WGD29933.1 cell wall hydrolase [Ancylobacter sp. WKF20]